MSNRIRTLIVEDEIFVALDLERILEDRGYDVVAIAADRDEALRHGALCDVAFVDINLRDGPTGPEIASTLATQHGVKIVFVTANPAQIGASAADAICYVRKPFADDAIVAAGAMAQGRDGGNPAVVQLSRPCPLD
jgi:two-component system, response regulator PdtaR